MRTPVEGTIPQGYLDDNNSFYYGKNNKGEFPSIPGVVPPPLEYPAGCRFHPRCPSAIQECAEKEPDFVLKGEHSWACPIT